MLIHGRTKWTDAELTERSSDLILFGTRWSRCISYQGQEEEIKYLILIDNAIDPLRCQRKLFLMLSHVLRVVNSTLHITWREM